jgi:hypothetical protein
MPRNISSAHYYWQGEELARVMWAPVLTAHRVTLEQMAILEPALSESVAATCISVIREAVDIAVSRGVPETAARDFVLGHLGLEIAVFFGMTEAVLSDSAQLVIRRAREALFRPDWSAVFEPSYVRSTVEAIVSR